MLTTSQFEGRENPPLYRIKELTDLFADACVRNEAGQLLFLSVFGRDTSIQQLLASFALGAKEGGLTQFKLQRPGAGDELVLIGDAGRLEKLTGRLPRQNLFGNLTHAWIFDPALVVADRANRIVWRIFGERPDPHSAEQRERFTAELWATLRQLMPVPLLDFWREPVLRAAAECVTWIEQLSSEPIGQVSGYKLALPDAFLATLSVLVRDGELTIEPTMH